MSKFTAQRMFPAFTLFLILTTFANVAITAEEREIKKNPAQSAETPESVPLKIGEKTAGMLRLRNVLCPTINPVHGPYGLEMTRRFPLGEGEHEEHDHPHHIGLWFTHGDANGHDFWTEESIDVTKFQMNTSDTACQVKLDCAWNTRDDELICTDHREILLRFEGEDLVVDYDVKIMASQGDLVLGDTKEGTMAVRLAPRLRVKGEVGTGTIVNSEGLKNADAWGKRALWCDDWGQIDGKTVGVAIFDHPENPIHPTWWMVREYGLFAANPFGVHNFEQKPRGTGDYKIPSGKTARFRYRILFHAGDVEQARIAERYIEYSQ